MTDDITMLDPIQFVASIPTIKSALLIGSDGAQIKLEIPETDIAGAAKLILFRGKALKVTIEEYEPMGTDDDTTGDATADAIDACSPRRRAGKQRK